MYQSGQNIMYQSGQNIMYQSGQNKMYQFVDLLIYKPNSAT